MGKVPAPSSLRAGRDQADTPTPQFCDGFHLWIGIERRVETFHHNQRGPTENRAGEHQRRPVARMEFAPHGAQADFEVEATIRLVQAHPPVRLRASAADFQHWLGRWRFLIHKARLGRAYCDRHGTALSGAMGELLGELGERALAPLGDHLAHDDGPLVIVPCGVLHGLPLHAARLRGRSLGVARAVSYGRSLLQLARCKEARPASNGVLVTGGGGGDLPAVERELEGVLACHGARAQRVGARELETALAKAHRAPGVLHLASHGAFRPDHPLFSGLELEGRYLAALDIPRLAVAGSVAVLSGCETARHVVSRGEELFGPEQSFFAAGACAVVASLWPVSDGMSAEFMGQLHGALAQGVSLVEALRAAQAPALEALRFPPTAAAFVVVGDARARLHLDSRDEAAPARIEEARGSAGVQK